MKKQIFKSEKGKGLTKKLDEAKTREFQDIYNPMKMFHQLKRLDFEQNVALKIARHYEDLFYKPLIKFHFSNETK